MSNLLKRGTTVSSDERVIDYNDLVKSKLKHIIEIQNNKDNVDADGFVNGLKADVVEQLLTGSEDDMNEEAATDASYEAQAASIIENASNEAQSIKDEANEILAQAHMEADRLLQEAKKQGYQQGAEGARQEYEDKAAQLARDYEAKAEQLTNEYEQLKAAIEPELVNNVCLPFTLLEPVMDKLNTKFWFANMQEKDPKLYGDVIESTISRTKVPVKTLLGESKINVSDFINLQVGDIIKIDKKVDQELDVYVGNIKKFKALPGYFEDKYAVRITDVIREESE